MKTDKPFVLLYFLIPFLLFSALAVWTSIRISRPEEALEAAREYVEEKVPGGGWQVSKVVKLGEGFNKKWRIEMSGLQNGARMSQANLVVDRWRPANLVGRFVMILAPPQILDGGWESPSAADLISRQIPLSAYLAAGAAFLSFQCFWLFRLRRRRRVLRRDGVLLAASGMGLLCMQLILETHPAYLAGYALVLSFIVWNIFSAMQAQDGT